MNEGLPRAAAMLQYKLIHSLTHTYNTEDAKKNSLMMKLYMKGILQCT